MLNGISRFVLEVLPYLLSALIAAVVVPGFLYSRAHGTGAVVVRNVPVRGENAPPIDPPGPRRVFVRPDRVG